MARARAPRTLRRRSALSAIVFAGAALAAFLGVAYAVGYIIGKILI
jgi:hypothetical protein